MQKHTVQHARLARVWTNSMKNVAMPIFRQESCTHISYMNIELLVPSFRKMQYA